MIVTMLSTTPAAHALTMETLAATRASSHALSHAGAHTCAHAKAGAHAAYEAEAPFLVVCQ
jgi:hypothetical protein